VRRNLKKERKREFHSYRTLDRMYSPEDYARLNKMVPPILFSFNYKVKSGDYQATNTISKKVFADGTFAIVHARRSLAEYLHKNNKESYDFIFVKPLRELPRYMNSSNEVIKAIARWRLLIGK
jgi:hypothetical protein